MQTSGTSSASVIGNMQQVSEQIVRRHLDTGKQLEKIERCLTQQHVSW